MLYWSERSGGSAARALANDGNNAWPWIAVLAVGGGEREGHANEGKTEDDDGKAEQDHGAPRFLLILHLYLILIAPPAL